MSHWNQPIRTRYGLGLLLAGALACAGCSIPARSIEPKTVPEITRDRIQKIDTGLKLEVTKIEGNRLNYRVAGKSAPAEAPPPPAADGKKDTKESP